jgi:alkyldihydroxyacetonephosphate synthase
MRRWNGWGDEAHTYPLPPSAAPYLESKLGTGVPHPDAPLEAVISSIPPARLSPHPLIDIEPEGRLRHARGQSLPDWVALRSGRIDSFPDGVSYPATGEQVREIMDYARNSGVRLIPYGGGTSVVGHINPEPGGIPTLSVDLSRLNRLIDLDETSRLATFEAGINGPDLERRLGEHGFTLGHFPQSFELSTLGGWIATRSNGQQSYYYGRIEGLFCGGRVETLRGPLDLPIFPASAAGPDLKHLILGSEGRLGMITQAVVRVRPLPERELFYGVFFRDWESGAAAARAIAQAAIPISMLRLSDAQETETTLVLSGKDRLVSVAQRGLNALGYGPGRSLLVYAVTGSQKSTAQAGRQARAIFRQSGGLFTGTTVGRTWQKSRFHTPYLRNTLWEQGYALDTVETALPWSRVLPAAAAVKKALQNAPDGAGQPLRTLVFAHLSSVYPDGASIYVTFIFHRAADPDQTLQRWQALKSAGSRAVISCGGTISHQHGVGVDHAPYLEAEKGPLGIATLEAVRKELDPEGILNPGKLLRG